VRNSAVTGTGGDVTREFSDGDANRSALTNVAFHLIFLRVN